MKLKTKRTLQAIALACVVATVWNFVPYWLAGDSLSEPWRAFWIWGVFPLSIPIFYAFIDRYFPYRPERDCPERNVP